MRKTSTYLKISLAALASVVLALLAPILWGKPEAFAFAKENARDYKRLIVRGDQYFKTGAYHAAATYYQQAVRLEDTNWFGHLKLGQCLARIGQSKEGLKELFNSILLNADDPEANLNARAEIASLLMQEGNYDEAGGQLKQILDLCPQDMVVRGNYAICLERIGFVDAAVSELKLIVQNDPWNKAAIYNLGSAYLTRGNYDLAIQCFKKVVSMEPKHVMARVGLARSLMRSGQNESALTLLKQTVQMAPDNHYAFLALGDAYENGGSKNLAVDSYKRAIQLNPRDPQSRKALERLLKGPGGQIAGANESVIR